VRLVCLSSYHGIFTDYGWRRWRPDMRGVGITNLLNMQSRTTMGDPSVWGLDVELTESHLQLSRKASEFGAFDSTV